MCCGPAVERAFAELTARGVPAKHAVWQTVGLRDGSVIDHLSRPSSRDPLGEAVTEVAR